MPGVGMFDGLCDREEGNGASLKSRARQMHGATIGFADLQYIGNTALPDFPGCPALPEA